MQTVLFFSTRVYKLNILYREKERVNSEFVLHWNTSKKFAFRIDQIGLSTIVGFVVDC